MLDSIDLRLFSKYPLETHGEIWKKLTPLLFSNKTVLPKDILCFLQKGTIRKYISLVKKEFTEEISVDFYFEGEIFTAKADNEIENQFVYTPISNGVLWYVVWKKYGNYLLSRSSAVPLRRCFWKKNYVKKHFVKFNF